MTHEEAIQLLPDLIKNRLEPSLREEVEAHVKRCEQCCALGETYCLLAGMPDPAAEGGLAHPSSEVIVQYALGLEALDTAKRDLVRSHFSSCSACASQVETVRLAEQSASVSLVPVRGRTMRRVAGKWLAAAAAALFVLSIATWHRLRRPVAIGVSRPAYVLALHSPSRGASPAPSSAPLGRPLQLLLFFPVPDRSSVTYDVEVTDGDGTSVFRARELRPEDLSEVRVLIPEGVKAPGLHTVTLTEKGVKGIDPLAVRFYFEAIEVSR